MGGRDKLVLGPREARSRGPGHDGILRRAKVIAIALASTMLFSLISPAHASHFVSLKSDKVYLREGPTYQHPILFIYRRKDYPLEVVAAYQSWRRVRDVDGTTGWISTTMLSDARTILIVGNKPAPVSATVFAGSTIVARAEPGVVAKLKACQPSRCKIAAGGVTGWVDKNRLWGVDAGEVFN